MTYHAPLAMALTAALGLASTFAASASGTDFDYYRSSSNASDKCHAWNPGDTDQIRSRVAGIQNIGDFGVAVACVYEVHEEDFSHASYRAIVKEVRIHFRNPPGSGTATASCTLLPGNWVSGFGTAMNRELELVPDSNGVVSFSGSWSSTGIGVNCTLPPNWTIAHTVLRFKQRD